MLKKSNKLIWSKNSIDRTNLIYLICSKKSWLFSNPVRKLRKTDPLRRSQKPGPKCRTSLHEELLVIMKLARLSLLRCCHVYLKLHQRRFHKMFKNLSEGVGCYCTSCDLLAVKQVIRQHLSNALEDCQHLRCTINCTEIFNCGWKAY